MNELATRTGGNDALDIAQHIGQMLSLGQTLVKSKLLPNGVNSPEAAVAIILKGRELGIPPMQALSHIHVISGKPTLSAELMMAMMLEAGHDVWIGRTDNQACTVKGIRRGKKREQELTFTIEDAEAAGVMNNPTWKKYKAAMLRARAISAFARMFAPDVLMGASYTPEELGAQVDADGEVIDVPASTPTGKPATRYEATSATVEPEDVDFTPANDEYPPEDDMPAEFRSEAETAPDVEKGDSTTRQRGTIFSILKKKIKVTDDHADDIRMFLSWLIDRKDSPIQSADELSKGQASTIIDRLLKDAENEWATWEAERKMAAEESAEVAA